MSEIKIHTLETNERLEDLTALNMAVHNIDSGFCRRLLELNPSGNNPSCHRYLTVDDRIVSGASLFRHNLLWYDSDIRAGEIGLVGTLDQFRNRGYARLLMNSWLSTMDEERIPLSFLWGIPGFYEKFHYHYAYPNHNTRYIIFPEECIEGFKPTGGVRPAVQDDLDKIRKLYRSYNSDLTGHHVRYEKLWQYYFDLTGGSGNEKSGWWVLENPSDGYAFVPDIPKSPPEVWEIAVASEEGLKNLVYGIFKEYRGLEKLGFRHHPDMPVGKWLYHWGAKIRSCEDIWKGSWGGMVRLNDPQFCLRKMEKKFSERLARSQFFNLTNQIAFSSELGSMVIEIKDGKVDVHRYDGRAKMEIPLRVLTPITTGYRGIERFRDDLKDIPDDTYEILSVLFPRDKVYMYSLLYADEHFSFPE
ncbi:MAG: GNAT family N-acetyltransferase [bacterium]|nr:GNAT family N-acetyltransferase [bacterium]